MADDMRLCQEPALMIDADACSRDKPHADKSGQGGGDRKPHLNIYFSRLIPQVAENAAAIALSEAKPLAWRRPTPKACSRAKSRGREGGDSRGKRVGESIPDGWRPEASPPAGRSHLWKQDASPPAEREREEAVV